MKKLIIAGLAVAMTAAMFAPAWADSIHIGDTTNVTNQGGQGGAGGQGGQGGKGGNANAVSGSYSGAESTAVSVSGAAAGAKSGAKSDSTSSVKIEAPSGLPMNTGVAVAPGLTSVGHYGCLGSWALALGGPGAAIGGGSTKRDKGCEHARDATILMGWGYPVAAMVLLSQNEDTLAALQRDPKAQAVLKVAGIMPAVENVPVKQSKVESTNFGERTSLTIPEALIANLAAQSAGAGM